MPISLLEIAIPLCAMHYLSNSNNSNANSSYSNNNFKYLFCKTILLMIDVAKFETFNNFTLLNKALLFLIKFNKTAVQSEPKN